MAVYSLYRKVCESAQPTHPSPRTPQGIPTVALFGRPSFVRTTKEVGDCVLRRLLWPMGLGMGSFRVLVGLASMVPLGLVGIPPVRLSPPVVLKSCAKVKSLIRKGPYGRGRSCQMPDVTIRLRGAHDADAGIVIIAFGAILIVAGIATRGWAGVGAVSIGTVVGLLGFVLLGQSSNRSLLRVHEDRIEWARGFAWRWFAHDPVPYSTVSGVFVAPRRRSILLARSGTRPPFILINPTLRDFARATQILRERLAQTPWVTSDIPLIKLLPPS